MYEPNANTQVITITETPEPQPELSSPAAPEIETESERVSSVDGMLMIYVPEGVFLMGAGTDDPFASPDELPQHEVYLDAFWIDKTEVTNGMYARCVAANACSPPMDAGSYTRSSYFNNDSYSDFPVIWVNWYQARDYCDWAGRRLPTEAEWEKAARGTDGRSYPWGEGIDCFLANFDKCVGDTAAVGSYPEGASPYGALDMAGNVYEWVADWYSWDYSTASSTNPHGPADGSVRVLRGGSWFYLSFRSRTANRHFSDPEAAIKRFGFRCAFTP